MTDQYPERIRLFVGRLVHAANPAGRLACRHRVASLGDRWLSADAPVTCLRCQRRMTPA